ncbi:MAG: heme exporter protein CcmD [Phenylobacterium sp.]
MLDLDPGPYGVYVWTSYGLSAAGLAWLVVSSLVFTRRWRRRAESLEARVRGAEGQPGDAP